MNAQVRMNALWIIPRLTKLITNLERWRKNLEKLQLSSRDLAFSIKHLREYRELLSEIKEEGR